MAQFDIYRNPNPETNLAIPFLLDMQSDLLEPLNTRVVAPLIIHSEAKHKATILNPCFEIEGQSVFLSTPELAGIPSMTLGRSVGSLAQHRDQIIATLDLLVTGF